MAKAGQDKSENKGKEIERSILSIRFRRVFGVDLGGHQNDPMRKCVIQPAFVGGGSDQAGFRAAPDRSSVVIKGHRIVAKHAFEGMDHGSWVMGAMHVQQQAESG
jgi:hypothetical protein